MVPLRAIETASLLLRLTLLVAALTVALGLIDGRAALAGSEDRPEAAAPATPTGWAIHREVVQPLPGPDVVD